AELVKLVDALSDPHSPQFRRFLTTAEFVRRFAPPPKQRVRVVAALHRAGFSSIAVSPDGTLVEASAASATAERFFGTQIHDFVQAQYGVRYANVRPVRVPAAIAPLVRDVELNSIVYARADTVAMPDAQPTVQVIQNGGFEHHLQHWKACDAVAISREHPYQGKYSALIGSTSPSAGNVKGLQAVCQQITIPQHAVLRAHTYSVSNLKVTSQGYQEIGFMRAPGKVAIVLRKEIENAPHWEHQAWQLDSLAGRTLYVFFAVAGNGQKRLYDSMFVDDVNMTGTVPTPTPSSSPTASPTPTPVGPGPGTPLSGPTFGPSGGWAPRGIADGIDLPVQHGYDGRGHTVAVLTQSILSPVDLAKYFTQNDITRTGSIKEVLVAPTTPPSGDPTEGMLDVEAMGALAPAANVVDYEVRDFTNTSILSGYQRAINDNVADVVDASFGECESDDPTFDDAVEQEAISAAAIGMTFVAAAGDLGSACYNAGHGNIAGVQVPAGNPHVLAIGGSDSDTSAGAANPVVWNGNNGLFVGAGGGGVSSIWNLPSYQLGLAGAASAQNRNVPDLSMPAVDDDLHISAADETVGGTSWSSAITAAALIESVQICGRFGWVNPAVYAAFGTLGEGTAFVDVIGGNNKFAAITPFYTAGTGYDNASGIGIPKGLAFAAALCGKTAALKQRF
ncbi:MAG: hypothetical protein JOY98_11380, partial [Candidatus Eremiobacteraeota bacterium]|nr:hypothetical protein [Candidatus Eremiobacteraeota bacterium]